VQALAALVLAQVAVLAQAQVERVQVEPEVQAVEGLAQARVVEPEVVQVVALVAEQAVAQGLNWPGADQLGFNHQKVGLGQPFFMCVFMCILM